MRKVTVRWRWLRRVINSSVEAMKVHPEVEQRTRIVNKIMQEGEPKNWGGGISLIGTMGLMEKENFDWSKICHDSNYHQRSILQDLENFGIRYDPIRNYPRTPDECYSPIDIAALALCRDREHRKVYRVDDGRFMGYLTGVSRANETCNKVDAVEIEPVAPEFTHWHPLAHVKFEA